MGSSGESESGCACGNARGCRSQANREQSQALEASASSGNDKMMAGAVNKETVAASPVKQCHSNAKLDEETENKEMERVGNDTSPPPSATSRRASFTANAPSPFMKGFTASCITLGEAAHMCHGCLAVILIAAGITRESERCAKIKQNMNSRTTTQESSMCTMFDLVLRQPSSPLKNALFAVFLRQVPAQQRKDTYYAQLGPNNSVWLALLTSYVRSGGQISLTELTTMNVDTATKFVKSLAQDFSNKNWLSVEFLRGDVAGLPHCTNTWCPGSKMASLVDPPATGFCTVMKCGDALSTMCVIQIMANIADPGDEGKNELVRLARGVARWNMCKETRMGWGTGTGTGNISSGNAGQPAVNNDSLLMLCTRAVNVSFASGTSLGINLNLSFFLWHEVECRPLQTHMVCLQKEISGHKNETTGPGH